MTKSLRYLVPAALLAVTAVWADEGRIPVFGVTGISQPGYYIVTRDISVASGDVVDISASDVTLDLNGRTLSATGLGALVGVGSGVTDLTIKNGRLLGGQYGIWQLYTTRSRLRIENVEIRDPVTAGILIAASEEIEVRNCRITGGASKIAASAIRVDGNGGPFRGRFIDNTIEAVGSLNGVVLTGMLGGEFRGNRIAVTTTSGGTGVILTGAPSTPQGGNLVKGNSFILSGFTGLSITTESSINQILENVFGGNGTVGLLVSSNQNRIADNVISGNNNNGVMINGSRNVVEGNLINENGNFGIEFGVSSNLNVYRNNVVRGNIVGNVADDSGTNTNAGGNVF